MNKVEIEKDVKTAEAILIVGVHRSGTSLTANWLHECGLHVGSNLLEGRLGNPKGLYEDEEIVKFHQKILEDNGLRIASLVKDGQKLTFSEEHYRMARQIIKDRLNSQPISWKDPRTAMFLDLWSEVIPNMKIFVVYRHYEQVINSVLRTLVRKDAHAKRSWIKRIAFRILFRPWNLPLMNRYLSAWNNYNKSIIAYAEKNPDKCIVYNLEDILSDSKGIITQVNEFWGYDFKVKDISSIFNQKYLNNKASNQPNFSFNKQLVKQADKIYSELNNIRNRYYERINK